MESLSAPRLVSATARRHGISRSQLRRWLRRRFAPNGPAAVGAGVRARGADGPRTMSELVADDRDTAIVVDLPTGGRLRIAASTPPALAAAVLKALR